MKRIVVLSLILVVAFAVAMVACGGGHHNMQRSAQFVWSAIPLFSTQKPLPSTASTFMDKFTVNAQVNAPVALTGNYSGFCRVIVPNAPVPSGQKIQVVIYGMGSWGISDCRDSNTPGIVPNVSGAPVIGDGSLTNLIVLARGNGTAADSGQVNIWVVGQSQPLPITCSLGVGDSNAHKSKCSIVGSVPVKDGDELVATITLLPVNLPNGTTQPGDSYSDVRVLLGKQ